MSPRRKPPVLLVVLLPAGTVLATAYPLRHERAEADRRSAQEGERRRP